MKRWAVVRYCSAMLVVAQMSRVGTASAQNVPVAEELYRRGVADFQAGRYEQGCKALADSFRMEELPGVLFTLATCEARSGKVASASAHFRDFLEFVSKLSPEQRLSQAERERVARAEREKLQPLVPFVTIELDEPLPEGAHVSLDGAKLSVMSLGHEMPIDPGVHVLEVRLASGAHSRTELRITQKEHRRVLLEVPAPDFLAPPPPQPSQGSDALFPWMVVAGALGGAGVAAGAVAGIVALDQKPIVDQHCPDLACDSTGAEALERGRTAGLVSTVSFGVGVGGLVTLLIMELSRGSQRSVGVSRGPQVLFTGNGAAVRGRF